MTSQSFETESTAELSVINCVVNDKIMNSPITPQGLRANDTSFSQNKIDDDLCDKYSSIDIGKRCSIDNELNILEERPHCGSDTTGLVDFVPPDASLVSGIISQVEYYFSDDNLPKDKFLLQQISRDKYGFVALSVIATFKKMKLLTTDLQAIAFALRQSPKLEVSKNGSRVRRTHSMPTDAEKLSKTVVAVNLLEPTVPGVKQQFTVCGTVNQVSVICRGEFVTAADVRRQVRGGLDSFGKAITGIALIEYDKLDSAHAACEQLTGSGNWRNDLHVSMLTIVSTSNKKHSVKSKDADVSGENGVEYETENKLGKRSKNLARSRVGEHSNEQVCANNQQSEQVASNPGLNSSNTGNEELSEEASLEQNQSGTKGVNPWMQRRLKASQLTGESSNSILPVDSDTDGLKKSFELIMVLRQPKGPDGSKGFCLARA